MLGMTLACRPKSRQVLWGAYTGNSVRYWIMFALTNAFRLQWTATGVIAQYLDDNFSNGGGFPINRP